MKKTMLAVVFVGALTGCGVIDSEHFGIRKTWDGEIVKETIHQGFYMAVTSSVREFTSKEIAINENGLRPKAGDNLMLKQLDVTFYYKVNSPTHGVNLELKYQNGSEKNNDDVWYPAWNYVNGIAREAIYKATSEFDSLILHTKREDLEERIRDLAQKKLDHDDPGAFTVTKVVARDLLTDESIEESIRQNVQREKELEAKEKQIKIATAQAQVEIEKAKGVAQANRIIAGSISPGYLQWQANEAIHTAAEKGNLITLLPSNGGQPIINLPKMQAADQ